MTAPSQDLIGQATSLIQSADALLIAAGAGMGVDSGLPDFRGPEGFWRAYPALREAGLTFSAAANPELFEKDAALAWGFYGHRLAMYRDTVPHPGFAMLRRWGQAKPQGCFVYTSNVDGQFQRAGWDADQIVECHGSIHHLQCTRPCGLDIWPAESLHVEINEARCHWTGPFPTCPSCGALARPNILMFGDGRWIDSRTHAQEARLQQWLEQVGRIVVIEIGAGRVVPSIRSFSHQMARTFGAGLIRINPDDTAVPGQGIAVPLTALKALSLINAQIDVD